MKGKKPKNLSPLQLAARAYEQWRQAGLLDIEIDMVGLATSKYHEVIRVLATNEAERRLYEWAHEDIQADDFIQEFEQRQLSKQGKPIKLGRLPAYWARSAVNLYIDEWRRLQAEDRAIDASGRRDLGSDSEEGFKEFMADFLAEGADMRNALASVEAPVESWLYQMVTNMHFMVRADRERIEAELKRFRGERKQVQDDIAACGNNEEQRAELLAVLTTIKKEIAKLCDRQRLYEVDLNKQRAEFSQAIKASGLRTDAAICTAVKLRIRLMLDQSPEDRDRDEVFECCLYHYLLCNAPERDRLAIIAAAVAHRLDYKWRETGPLLEPRDMNRNRRPTERLLETAVGLMARDPRDNEMRQTVENFTF